MTLPDNKIETVIAIIRHISQKYNIPPHILAKDATKPNGEAISPEYLYKILDSAYDKKPLAGGPVEKALFRLIEKLKIDYPEDCPQEIKPR